MSKRRRRRKRRGKAKCGSITVLKIHAQPRKQQQQLYRKAKNCVDCVQKLLCSEHRVTQ
jgi:hypothetical protein